MKQQMKSLFVVVIFATLIVSVGGCKKETIVETKTTNLEGFAPGANCNTCHDASQDTSYYVAGRKYQWAQSKHANGGDIERNGADCAGCHTTEGFVQRMNGLTVTDQVQPSPPGCFACHSPHSRADFSLRKSTPVTFLSNIAGVSHTPFNYGKGNLCAQCHQPRDLGTQPKPDPTKIAATDSIVITSSRWYSHYGVQGEMLMGEGGFQFPGVTYTNSPHTNIVKEVGCISCHMAEMAYNPTDPSVPSAPGTGKGGGHTMNIGYEWEGTPGTVLTGCNQSGCHTSPQLTTTDYKGLQTMVGANLDTLKKLLATKGWLDTTTTSVKLTSGKRVIKPAIKSGALWNYLFVTHDLSQGVHNSSYANGLLRSSIDELRKP
jgi:hypothetical protein